MKSVFAALLITVSFTQIAAANDPAITPEARDRFLNGVHDFAGGRTVPGAAQDENPVGTGGVGGVTGQTSSSGASWRSPDGSTSGTIVRSIVAPTPFVTPTIQRPVIIPPQIVPANNVSPWPSR